MTGQPGTRRLGRDPLQPKSLILRGFGSTNVLARVANPVLKHRKSVTRGTSLALP